MLTCPSARSPSGAQRWSAQTGVRQNRAGQGRIPPDFTLCPPPPPRTGGSRWGRSCNSSSDLDPVGLTPSLLRPPRTPPRDHRAPAPFASPRAEFPSDAHLRATPARQGPSYSASPCLPLPAAAAPDPGPQAKPLSQCELPLLHIHPLSSTPPLRTVVLGRLCQCGFENGNKCPTLGVDCGAGAVPVGWQT